MLVRGLRFPFAIAIAVVVSFPGWTGDSEGFEIGSVISKPMHEDMVRLVLGLGPLGEGYSDKAITRVTRWVREPDLDGAPVIGFFNVNDVQNEFGRSAADFHFDDLRGLPTIRNAWADLEGFTAASMPTTCDRGGQMRILRLMGVTLHAVQDFYTHSNWVEHQLAMGRTPQQIDIWYDTDAAEQDQISAARRTDDPTTAKDERLDPNVQNLMTGWWKGDSSLKGSNNKARMQPTHGELNKDDDDFLASQGRVRYDAGSTYHSIALHTAINASHHWVRQKFQPLVDQNLPGCVNQLKAYWNGALDPQADAAEAQEDASDLRGTAGEHTLHDSADRQFAQETEPTFCSPTPLGFAVRLDTLGAVDTWSKSSIWHVTTFAGAGEDGDLDDHSGQARLYFGSDATGTFDTGAAISGTATSIAAGLPPGDLMSLKFASKWAIEAVEPTSFDIMTVEVLDSASTQLAACTLNSQISAFGGPSDAVCSDGISPGGTYCPSPAYPQWEWRGLGFTAPLDGVVAVRFSFSTGDNLYNNFMGWMIDDVRISRDSSPPAS